MAMDVSKLTRKIAAVGVIDEGLGLPPLPVATRTRA
jgi:hypothetical protein